MKKIAIIIALLLACYTVNAQVNFGLPTILGIGYSRTNVHNDSTKDTFNTIELTGCGFYCAIGNCLGNSNIYYKDSVYGYGTYTDKSFFKLGVSSPRLYFNSNSSFLKHSIGITGYWANVNSSMQDSSGNYIGWNDYQNLKDYKTATDYSYSYFGVKIDYSFSFVNVGVILSSKEIGFSVNIVFEMLSF